LLCISEAAIPSKLYEYIPTGKPVLAVTPKNSAVWRICEGIKHVYLVDSDDLANTESTVMNFLDHCRGNQDSVSIPEELSPGYISKKFMQKIDELIN
jgi:hypothetical protein